jgi:hypothetical protein
MEARTTLETQLNDFVHKFELQTRPHQVRSCQGRLVALDRVWAGTSRFALDTLPPPPFPPPPPPIHKGAWCLCVHY